ncbi:MAG: hypothetical protein COV70_00240 [Parcubacteria group bacterium CG11_big_fil_rev_8_21_14_0_20_39_22]|nr:MAG: hypothetical protein COV70_00240 [Parcubacteria group bacterium CG11_big_fil_rev_8_21_14_0_20_39_22]
MEYLKNFQNLYKIFKNGFLLILFAILFLPIFAHAQIFINEIAWMGTENSASDEWIELYNSGSTSIDLTGWSIKDVQDKLSISLEGEIEAGGYFLLERTDDSSVPNVPADYIYTGALSNSGATLILFDSAGSEIDKVVGGENWEIIGGDNSTKETAGRSGSSWITALSSPRSQNIQQENSSNSENQNTDTGSSSSQETYADNYTPPSYQNIKIEPQLFPSISAPSVMIAGVSDDFSGSVLGKEKKPIENARFIWNFGDGSTVSGKKVSHSYLYPGDYIVFMDAASGEYSNSARVVVKVVAPEIFISLVKEGSDGAISVSNDSKYEIALDFWQIQVGQNFFVIPKNTYILPYGTATFPNAVTGLSIENKSDVMLLFPNRQVAASFDPESSESSQISQPQTNIESSNDFPSQNTNPSSEISSELSVSTAESNQNTEVAAYGGDSTTNTDNKSVGESKTLSEMIENANKSLANVSSNDSNFLKSWGTIVVIIALALISIVVSVIMRFKGKMEDGSDIVEDSEDKDELKESDEEADQYFIEEELDQDDIENTKT